MTQRDTKVYQPGDSGRQGFRLTVGVVCTPALSVLGRLTQQECSAYLARHCLSKPKTLVAARVRFLYLLMKLEPSVVEAARELWEQCRKEMHRQGLERRSGERTWC